MDDWIRVNRATPRLVDCLPNGPRNHPTVQVFLAGGVPEVMLHLRRMGLLHGDVLTATGDTLDATLDWWEGSERRRASRARLAAGATVSPDDVIMGPDAARRAGLTSTVVFPVGNLAPDGSVIKATALDPSVVGEDQVFRHRGPARVFTDEREAIRAIKGQTERPVQARRRDRPDRQRSVGHRDAGDGPDHLRAQVPPVGQAGRAGDRRPLLRRLDRRVHRARRPRGARRAARSAGCATTT